MANNYFFEKFRSCRSPQVWGWILTLIFSQLTLADDYIVSIIDGQKVVEFGDFGKAPNQYPLTVGDTNVISSDIVTQLEDRTYFLQSVIDELKDNLND